VLERRVAYHDERERSRVDDAVVVGRSPAMTKLEREVAVLAAQPVPVVLVVGETGSGKALVARRLHYGSSRAQGPFVELNAAAIPETLVESELFGHERGAFTGAIALRKGAFEAADRGTLFLDELGELPLPAQAKLLRVLEDRTVTRLGATKSVTVDVRVVAATNRDLEAEITAGRFREDLYFRLNVHVLRVPPLRERLSDVPALADLFLTGTCARFGIRKKKIAPEALDLLMGYEWRRNNVRELRNVVERIIVRTRGEVALRAEHLPKEFSVRAAIAAVDGGAQASVAPSKAAAIMQRIVSGDESFWSAVYAPFMARDLTREHVRMIITMGLQQTRGNYKMLLPLFNMAPTDYKRLLTFLRKYQCHVSFQQFRSERPAAAAAAPADVHRDTPPLVA
jgi:transcriptional regulator with GAF, ATPase, and Fis domain